MRLLMIFLGLIFGSLGSVVMTRFSDGITKKNLHGFFFGRSECPDCKHILKAKNLIPVVSYLVQGGKCEYCKKKISRIYPALELLCAGIFVATYFLLKDFGIETLVFGLLTNWLLILLLVYDLKTYELHMIVRILLTALGIVANVNISGGGDGNFLISTVMFGATFLLIYLFAKRYVKMRFKKHEEGFGQGDVFLAVSIGTLFPVILSFHNISFSRMTIVNVLILFILMSSIIGLIRAGGQYISGKLKVESGKLKVGNKSTSLKNSEFGIQNSELKIVPFFPAMIIAFWILAWKLSFFISLLFPLAG